jgi:hypothetical protein
MYQKYLNQVEPEWQARFNTIDRSMKIDKMKGDTKVNDDYDYEYGNRTNFTMRHQRNRDFGLETPEETADLIKNFDVISKLLRIEKLSLSSEPVAWIIAQDYLESLKDKDLDKDQLEKKRTISALLERNQNTSLKLKQEETSRTMLADLWDNKLTDPNVVTGALRQGFLSDTDAKYLRDAMLNPKPAKTTLESMSKGLDIVRNCRNEVISKQDALSGITALLGTLASEDGKSLVKELQSDFDKEDSFWEKEAYQTIEKRLMTIDPLSGKLFGSTDQINATDRAKIRFDDAVKSAAKSGKPLKGTDYLKKAVEISNQLMPKEKLILFGGQKLPAGEFEEFTIKEKPENPFSEYPDAYQENGIWYVMRDGKRYRIQP